MCYFYVPTRLDAVSLCITQLNDLGNELRTTECVPVLQDLLSQTRVFIACCKLPSSFQLTRLVKQKAVMSSWQGSNSYMTNILTLNLESVEWKVQKLWKVWKEVQRKKERGNKCSETCVLGPCTVCSVGCEVGIRSTWHITLYTWRHKLISVVWVLKTVLHAAASQMSLAANLLAHWALIWITQQLGSTSGLQFNALQLQTWPNASLCSWLWHFRRMKVGAKAQNFSENLFYYVSYFQQLPTPCTVNHI